MSADEIAMQAAFADFMGRGRSKPSGNARCTSLGVDSGGTLDLEVARELQLVKKLERKYWQILNAFQGTLERDWLQVDDNLGDVVSSIANLRSRIWMESSKIHERANAPSQESWKRAYRRCNQGLTRDDIQLALTHDLLKHEDMMAGARTLLSSIAEAQGSLGRRLEELLTHQMAVVELLQGLPHFDPLSSSSIVTVMKMVDGLTDIFVSLASELYRKQWLVQTVIDSTNDDLLVNVGESVSRKGEDPRAVADKCSRSWSRRSSLSCVDESAIQGLLRLGTHGKVL